jgi:hypothetical protein
MLSHSGLVLPLLNYFLFFFPLFFETGSPYVAQAVFEVLMLLRQPLSAGVIAVNPNTWLLLNS